MVLERTPAFVRLVAPLVPLVSVTTAAGDKTLGTIAIPDFLGLGFNVYRASVGVVINRISNSFAGANSLSGLQYVVTDFAAAQAQAITLPDTSFVIGTAEIRGQVDLKGDYDSSGAVYAANNNSLGIKIASALAAHSNLELREVQAFIDCFFV